MSFKDQLAADNTAVFLNLNEFAQLCTVTYDGREYPDVTCVLTGRKEQARRQLIDDHIEGLYRAAAVLHCAEDALGGLQPERGMRLDIEDAQGTFTRYYVHKSLVESGLLRVELEAVDE